MTNYRPISLLSIVSKLLERHMHKLISMHLEIYSPFSLINGDFSQKCQQLLLFWMFINYTWAMAVDKGKEVCAVFFDLKKACDSVPHRSLVAKLESINWLK